MREVREISDLRPAPRTAPVALLWVLALVAAGGVLLLAVPHGHDVAESLSGTRPESAADHLHATATAASAVVAHAGARP
jgi:hypothetical protein